MKRALGTGITILGLLGAAACGSGGDGGFGRLLPAVTGTPVPVATTATPRAGTPRATQTPAPQRGVRLTGVWTGQPRCDDGDQVASTFRVAPSGNPMHEYDTKNGARSEELKSVGQTIRFIPPEGGVSTIVVDTLSVGGERISYTLRLSHERTNNGTLTQQRGALTVNAAAKGTELDFSFALKESVAVSQPGFVLPPSESATSCAGPLKRN